MTKPLVFKSLVNTNIMSQVKLKFVVTLLLFASLNSQAQLTIQYGAGFLMQAGAHVTVEGSVANAGILSNNGTLKVQGNYINAGSCTGIGPAAILEMYGTGNSNLNAGVSAVANLVINKTGASDVVKLTGSVTVSNSLTYINGIFTTDPLINPSFFISSPVTAAYNFAPGKEIVGSVKRTSWSGGGAHLFNSANMKVATNGGTAPTDVTVTMIPLSAGGDPSQAEREVKRKYTFVQTAGSGFTADVRLPYMTAELNTNVEINLVPWTLTANEWNAKLNLVNRDVQGKFVSTTGITATQFAQEWKLADPEYTFNTSVYIKGGWNNSSGFMRTSLNANNLLPLSQPYAGAPFFYTAPESVGFIPNANVVDWVLLELRKPASGLAADATVATATGRKAFFLLNDGTIVNLDGATPAKMSISKQGAGNYVVVRHRNHLAVISLAKSSNATGDFANNFSLLANVYQKPGAASAPVSLLSASAPGNTKYGMWPGDVNNSGSVTLEDISPINTAVGGPATGNTNVYNVRDANLDRNVTAADVSVVNSSIAAFAQTSAGRLVLSTLPISQPISKPANSSVPGEGQTNPNRNR